MRTRNSKSPPAYTISVRSAPSGVHHAIINAGGRAIRVAIGKSGVSSRKREGDGATPLAQMRLLYGFWRPDRIARPITRLRLKPIRRGMLWCDAPQHGLYNRPATAPFTASHEVLARDDHLYDICLVMDFNITSRRRQGGSAIFLHLARPGYLPTEGCFAVRLSDMRLLLAAVRPGTMVRVKR